ncbi:hypothetical protein BV898_01951 [Hypsibius exemplaris]|uniref:KASH domain-containing protein n=1 Tax=Hypsibius exemplaris TaxID=2072580 RepID=A0A1W0XA59_HYPEX|nr:hypothetical protein BV898_01951 [Hypsibius exemplaris]
MSTAQFDVYDESTDIIIRPVATREEHTIVTSEKVVPQLGLPLDTFNSVRIEPGVDDDKTILTIKEREKSFGKLTHRVAPKDDAFSVEYKSVPASTISTAQFDVYDESTDIIIGPVATREELTIVTGEKVVPQLGAPFETFNSVRIESAVDDDQTILTIKEHEKSFGKLIHRVAPKDDAFSVDYRSVPASTISAAQFDVYDESTDTIIRPVTTREELTIVTGEKVVPQLVVPFETYNSVRIEPGVDDDQFFLTIKGREKSFEILIHRVAPKDDAFSVEYQSMPVGPVSTAQFDVYEEFTDIITRSVATREELIIVTGEKIVPQFLAPLETVSAIRIETGVNHDFEHHVSPKDDIALTFATTSGSISTAPFEVYDESTDIITRPVTTREELTIVTGEKIVPQLGAPLETFNSFRIESGVDDDQTILTIKEHEKSFGKLTHRVAPKDDAFSVEYQSVPASTISAAQFDVYDESTDIITRPVTTREELTIVTGEKIVPQLVFPLETYNSVRIESGIDDDQTILTIKEREKSFEKLTHRVAPKDDAFSIEYQFVPAVPLTEEPLGADVSQVQFQPTVIPSKTESLIGYIAEGYQPEPVDTLDIRTVVRFINSTELPTEDVLVRHIDHNLEHHISRKEEFAPTTVTTSRTISTAQFVVYDESTDIITRPVTTREELTIVTGEKVVPQLGAPLETVDAICNEPGADYDLEHHLSPKDDIAPAIVTTWGTISTAQYDVYEESTDIFSRHFEGREEVVVIKEKAYPEMSLPSDEKLLVGQISSSSIETEPIDSLPTVLYSRRMTLPDIHMRNPLSTSVIVHRNGPRDDWYQEDIVSSFASVNKLEEMLSTVTDLHVTEQASNLGAEPSASQQPVIMITQEDPSHSLRGRRSSILLSDLTEDAYLHESRNYFRITHRTGPKDPLFETMAALGYGGALPAADQSLEDLIEQSEILSQSSSRYIDAADLRAPSNPFSRPRKPLSRSSSISRVSTRSTSILAAEEDVPDIVAVDIPTATAVATPRVLSRAPSRSSISRTSSRASFDITSTQQQHITSQNVSEYLQSERSTVSAWLTQSETTMTQIATSDVTDLTEILRSRPLPAGILHQSSLLTSTQVSSSMSSDRRAIVHVDVDEVNMGLIVHRPAEHAYGRSSPLLEFPAQIMPAVETMSAETVTETIRVTRQTHTCLVAYYHLYQITIYKLESLKMFIVDPEVQHIDPEILDRERDRFAVLLDRLIRTNAELGRLDDLYRAILASEPNIDVQHLEAEHKLLNILYMQLLSYLRVILRRQKYLHKLLEKYQKERMEFKIHLLDQMTYLRTNENVSEAEQQESLAFVLEEAMKLKYSTYQIMVRSTPEFCSKLEEEVVESMLLLRAELAIHTELESTTIVEHIFKGQEVEYVEDVKTIVIRSGSAEPEVLDEESETRTTISSASTSTTTTTTTTTDFSIEPSPRNRPVWRAFRRAVPMQTLALVLIGFASLIPMANDDYACLFENYFASSFNPMLKFQGTPPF